MVEAAVRVRGLDGSGTVCAELPLEHGADLVLDVTAPAVSPPGR